jgi:hypothetical protein
MTLDFLVDELADAMHAERKLRAAFNRDIGNKVLFIKDGKLLFLKGIKLKAIADRQRISHRCAPVGPSPSSSSQSWDRTRHSPCGSSMYWATSPLTQLRLILPDSPALDAGLSFPRSSIGAVAGCRFPTDAARPRARSCPHVR